jgi:hypothetical protein
MNTEREPLEAISNRLLEITGDLQDLIGGGWPVYCPLSEAHIALAIDAINMARNQLEIAFIHQSAELGAMR